MTCDAMSTRAGEPVVDAFGMAAACPAVFALGINCTAPSDAAALVRLAASYGKPVVVYPNSGEGWDAARRAWTGSVGFDSSDVRSWVADGARLVGGCCRVDPENVAAIAAAISA
jgi:homocysteine S-methyltransferase